MITFTILATTFTVSILTLIFLGTFFLILLVLIYKWVNGVLNRDAITKAREIIKSSIPRTTIDSKITPPQKVWLETLIEHGYVKSLYGTGIHIVLGTPEMGTSSIFHHIYTEVNSSFLHSSSMCAYVDVKQTVKSSQAMGHISIDDVYRSVIWSSVYPPVNLLKSEMSLGSFHRTKLEKELTVLNNTLNIGLARLSHITIKKSLFQIWQTIGVKRVVFLVEDLTAIDQDSIPALLGYLIRTFGHTPSVSFIISGNPANLILNKSTEDGYVGVQLMHDARIDIDLPGLLKPQDNFSRQDTSVRLSYLDKLRQIIYPESNVINIERDMFSPQNLWQTIFDAYEGNIDEIAKSFEKLFSYYNEAGKKINRKTIRDLLFIDIEETK